MATIDIFQVKLSFIPSFEVLFILSRFSSLDYAPLDNLIPTIQSSIVVLSLYWCQFLSMAALAGMLSEA